jgi:predicted nucleotidyltransferase component of viral defense system
MIPSANITEWKSFAPWVSDAQVEQDLVISRALIDIFSNPLLSKKLAFRGGTALYKLFLSPASRYSEDIDLVQKDPSPVGEIVNLIRAALSPFLGDPVRKIAERGTTLTFAFQSESSPVTRLKLKIEINTREHAAVFGFQENITQLNRSGFQAARKYRPICWKNCWGRKCAHYIREEKAETYLTSGMD